LDFNFNKKKIFMNKILLTIGLLLLSHICLGQSEIETLEKMYKMTLDKRASEGESQEKVWEYYTYLKQKVRDKRDKITDDEFISVNKFIEMGWSQIKRAIKENFGGSYSAFLRANQEFLEDYKEDNIERLYKFIYN